MIWRAICLIALFCIIVLYMISLKTITVELTNDEILSIASVMRTPDLITVLRNGESYIIDWKRPWHNNSTVDDSNAYPINCWLWPNSYAKGMPMLSCGTYFSLQPANVCCCHVILIFRSKNSADGTDPWAAIRLTTTSISCTCPGAMYAPVDYSNELCEYVVVYNWTMLCIGGSLGSACSGSVYLSPP